MSENLPIILIPGLGTSPRTYSSILPELWKRGSVTIANQTKENSIEAIAKRILAKAPPRFALFGQTGPSSAESKQLSIQAGFKYHLVKPIDINALFELVFFKKMNHLAVIERY